MSNYKSSRIYEEKESTSTAQKLKTLGKYGAATAVGGAIGAKAMEHHKNNQSIFDKLSSDDQVNAIAAKANEKVKAARELANQSKEALKEKGIDTDKIMHHGSRTASELANKVGWLFK